MNAPSVWEFILVSIMQVLDPNAVIKCQTAIVTVCEYVR